MRSYNARPEWANQPFRLNTEERHDPYAVLDDFFSCFHLQDVREVFWDWLVAAISSESGAYTTGYARSNLIFVYEKMEKLVEAAHGLHRRRKKSMKRKHRPPRKR